MSNNEIQLTINDILEKDFKKAVRGYSQEEVDEYLDIIIQDYEKFQQQILELRNEVERLQKMEDTNTSYRRQQTPSQVNYDVLKRLSNLEKAVFGNKLAEKES